MSLIWLIIKRTSPIYDSIFGFLVRFNLLIIGLWKISDVNLYLLSSIKQLAYWFVEPYSAETETNTLLFLASFGFPKLVRMNACRNDRNKQKGCQQINGERHSEEKKTQEELLLPMNVISNVCFIYPFLQTKDASICDCVSQYADETVGALKPELHHSTFWASAQSDHRHFVSLQLSPLNVHTSYT